MSTDPSENVDEKQNADVDVDTLDSNERDLEQFLESTSKITLAGLGGALVGLSKEKTVESLRVLPGGIAATAARSKRSPSVANSNLPMKWSMSCGLFVGVIEAVRYMSPATHMLKMTRQSTVYYISDEWYKASGTIGDYAIGGAVAGTSGSIAQNSQLRKRMPRTMFRGGQAFAGFFPGICLGLVAGVLQASLEYGQNLAAQEKERS